MCENRSWKHSEENKRRTLQRNDISAAINRTDIFDFLVDIVPQGGEDQKNMVRKSVCVCFDTHTLKDAHVCHTTCT